LGINLIGDKMEQCNICGKTFVRSSNLRMHMQVHDKNQIPNRKSSIIIDNHRSPITDQPQLTSTNFGQPIGQQRLSRVDSIKEQIELIRLLHEKEKLEKEIYQEKLQEQKRLDIERQERSDRNFKELMEMPKKLDMIRKTNNNGLSLPDNAKRPKYADEIDEEDDYEDDEDYEDGDY